MRAIDPLIQVRQQPGITVADAHAELHDVDVIIGCVDDDGPGSTGSRSTRVPICLDELDPAEVARRAKSGDQQALDREHGYGTGTGNPSVVYLNGLTVHATLIELAAWLSGSRPPATWLDVHLLRPWEPDRLVGAAVARVRTASWERAAMAAGVGVIRGVRVNASSQVV